VGGGLADEVVCQGDVVGVTGGEEVEEGLGECYFGRDALIE